MNLFGVILGASITLVLNLCVSKFLEKKKKLADPEKPAAFPEETWKVLTVKVGSGEWIGRFECVLSFISFCTGHPNIIIGWLAFKVAAKWEAWKNIVQMPDSLEDHSSLDWYTARRAIGSWLLSRFLIGTLGNIIAGAVGAYSVSWLCSVCATP